LLAPLLAASLAGCAVGRPLSFTGRTNSFCSDALASIAKLKAPSDPEHQMRYAMDSYSAIEKAVSQTTDSSLPGGSSGDRLREAWLRPARASLTAGRSTLRELSEAVRDHDRAAAESAFAATASVGREGVDVSLLRADGLDRCASLFSEPS